MTYLIVKALLSGAIIAIVSEVARRNPALGAFVVSLPLVSLLAMIWLWRDTHDPVRLANNVQATFWYVLPSLPMFLLIPVLLRRGVGFWPSLGIGCAVTMGLYFAMVWAGGKAGLRL